jgi:DNA-binding NarL/FixJ family response regulator
MSTSGLDSLSSQELQVARAVGRGLNNLEAAAALFVSRKTVEAHLTRAYRKLGIRSRTELTRLLVIHDQAR